MALDVVIVTPLLGKKQTTCDPKRVSLLKLAPALGERHTPVFGDMLSSRRIRFFLLYFSQAEIMNIIQQRHLCSGAELPHSPCGAV